MIDPTKRNDFKEAILMADGSREKLNTILEAIDYTTDHYESLLRKIFEEMELQDIDELLNKDVEDILEVVRYLNFINKKAHRRNTKLQNELKETYSRRDMMEFAEYVGRLYTLTGKSHWTKNDEEDNEDDRITPNDILNRYERDKEMDNLPGRDEVDIKKGFDGSSLGKFIYD